MDNYLPLLPIRFMHRGLTTILFSLMASYCAAQEAGAIPVQVLPSGGLASRLLPAPDSSSVITDLVHLIRENSKVVLNWKLADTALTDFFTIERSCNSKDYEVVAVIRLASKAQWFEWVDESPAKGRNIYRIRCASGDNQVIYSGTIQVQIAGDISFKFYPNPVDNILIIRSDNPLDVHIVDATGKLRLSHSNVQGLQTINVSTLEKGIYLLRLQNRLANTTIQERLIKN